MTRAFVWLIALAIASCADSPCGESLAEFCTSSSPCPMTWSAAQDPASWGECDPQRDEMVYLSSCNDIMVASAQGVDTGTIYSYDAATGELISVSTYVRQAPRCVAGTPAPVCNDPMARRLCP